MLGKSIFVLNIYFIYVTFNLIKENPQTAIEEFSKLRNSIYIIYIIVFAAIGLLILILRKQDEKSPFLTQLQSFLPNLVVSLILTTFSYAIAKYISDLLM